MSPPSKAELQVAFDKGAGHRCISHHRDNPYSFLEEPELRAAYDQGWAKTDAEATAAARR